MNKRIAIVLALLAVSSLAAVASAAPRRHHHPRPRPPVQECPLECGVKLDHGPWNYSSPDAVTSVCIKAGRELVSFTADGSNGCFSVSGLGTTRVTVRQEHEGRRCDNITSVVFYRNCNGGGGNMPG